MLNVLFSWKWELPYRWISTAEITVGLSLSLCLSLCLSLFVSLCLCLCVCPSVSLSVPFSFSLCLSLSLSLCVSACLSVSFSLSRPYPSLSLSLSLLRSGNKQVFFFFWVLSRDSGLDMRWRQSTTKTGKLCLIGTGDESSCYEYMMCVQIKLSVSATARVLTEKLKNTWALHCCDVHSKQRFREICYQDVCSEKNSAISSALNEFFCKVCCQDMCSKRTATSAAEMSVQRKYSTTSTA